jgi:hypothetical protein
MHTVVNVFINELSLLSTEENRVLADSKMDRIANILRVIRDICEINNFYGHSCLISFQISENYTILDWTLKQSHDEKILFMQILTKEHYFVDSMLHQSCAEHNCYFLDKNFRDSSLAGACYKQLTDTILSIMISNNKSHEYTGLDLPITFSIGAKPSTRISIINFSDTVQPYKKFFNRYLPSPKHKLGGAGTFMDIDDVQAQQVLSEGILYYRQYYGYSIVTRKFYKFMTDNVFNTDAKASFHGYPVPPANVPENIRKALLAQYREN